MLPVIEGLLPVTDAAVGVAELLPKDAGRSQTAAVRLHGWVNVWSRRMDDLITCQDDLRVCSDGRPTPPVEEHGCVDRLQWLGVVLRLQTGRLHDRRSARTLGGDSLQEDADGSLKSSDHVWTSAGCGETHANPLETHTASLETRADLVQKGVDQGATPADGERTFDDSEQAIADRLAPVTERALSVVDGLQEAADRTAVAADRMTTVTDRPMMAAD